MDSKIMGLIDTEIAKLPRKRRKQGHKQYEAAKQKLCRMFPGCAEHEYICKNVSKKYKV